MESLAVGGIQAKFRIGEVEFLFAACHGNIKKPPLFFEGFFEPARLRTSARNSATRSAPVITSGEAVSGSWWANAASASAAGQRSAPVAALNPSTAFRGAELETSAERADEFGAHPVGDGRSHLHQRVEVLGLRPHEAGPRELHVREHARGVALPGVCEALGEVEAQCPGGFALAAAAGAGARPA